MVVAATAAVLVAATTLLEFAAFTMIYGLIQLSSTPHSVEQLKTAITIPRQPLLCLELFSCKVGLLGQRLPGEQCHHPLI